ncbi:hypothetical protein SLEP1_g45729 [Rubroshorea leprosula]|uniref:Histone-lysine N-methyltransferase ATX2 n=1 Tax=Rubroshorea leprosula TaxID=152421 RepID=A0AAV5LLI6_9ROSI|nr:hypothetical protein SLEP1_g45729 [Rubroshorea leprosula]
MAFLEKRQDDDAIGIDTTDPNAPLRYLSLDRIYSTASLCVGSNVMSKKVKARKLIVGDPPPPLPPPPLPLPLPLPLPPPLKSHKPPLLRVYTRRPKSPPTDTPTKSYCGSLHARDGESASQVAAKLEIAEFEEVGGRETQGQSGHLNKRRRVGSSELVKLGINSNSTVLWELERPRLRDCRNNSNVNKGNSGSSRKRKRDCTKNLEKDSSSSITKKKWFRLSFDGVHPEAFIGLRCKVFWPLDADWYMGRVVGYNSESNRHSVKYEDGDQEDLVLSNENIKFCISLEEMGCLNLSCNVNVTDNDGYHYDEMVVLAASLDDCQGLEPGDIIWAKLTGHAMWPAIVVDESLIGGCKGLSKIQGGRSVPVQFFGTHDFARIKLKQVVSFLKGLLSSFHLKCKKPRFTWSLEEAKRYLSERKLPKRMQQLQKRIDADNLQCKSNEYEENTESDDDSRKDEGILRAAELLDSPYVEGDLQIINLGEVVKDSEYFHDDGFFWPEGYTALRKFSSITDPSVCTLYKMEVLRDPQSKNRPLFRVTIDNGEQFEGSTPSACWNRIYKRIQKIQNGTSDSAEVELGRISVSGPDMFGFSNPEVVKLIQDLSKSRLTSKFSKCKLGSGRYRELAVGYRPVRVKWKDLDKCSVCHMDEEYENNLFLQCDKCRIMVHARCYGELEPVDGVLWLCNLCRPGAPESPPPCCLCPVVGGAMKPTMDGRWAHLACAIWIPETCLSDVKRMEPIDGLNRINKDRWKLLCSICQVSYGACIQCSNSTCRVAYHPLCARAAGLCVELEDEDRLHLLSVDDEDEDQCIRLVSFCKKHKQPSNERKTVDKWICGKLHQCYDYIPPINPSGCARTEPYNHLGRRGRKEPEALAAASLKRLFVENQPYLVGGYCQRGVPASMVPYSRVTGLKISSGLHRLKAFQPYSVDNILSAADKYKYMRETFRKRLAFGKSGIHGFGIFAKHPHRAGDMVIEYTGELVRPSIADRREHLIYNSLVGAGTYMFRINAERVTDATRAGSIAHLINHSCEPNCYSRLITVNGDEHVIIFAKRDIKRWEELTYDYRFFSIDERLACYCGFPSCQGVVNDTESEEQVAKKIYVPRNELTE